MKKSDKWQIRIVLICGLYFVIRLAVGQEYKVWCDSVWITDGSGWHRSVVNCDTFNVNPVEPPLLIDTALLWYFPDADSIRLADTIFGEIVFIIRGGRVRWREGYWHDNEYYCYRRGKIKAEDIIYFIQKP